MSPLPHLWQHCWCAADRPASCLPVTRRAAPQAPQGQRAGGRWGQGDLQREAQAQCEAYATLQLLPAFAGKLPMSMGD